MNIEPVEPGPEALRLPRTARPARFTDAIVLIVVFLGTQAVLGALLGLVLIRTSWKISSTFVSILEIGALAATIVAIRHRLKTRYQSFFPVGCIKVSFIATAAIGAVGMVLLVTPVQELIAQAIPIPKLFRSVFSVIAGPSALAGSLLLASVVAPSIEEILFRGIILDGFMQNYGNTRALILSAVLFGIVHLNPWQFVTGLFLGLFIGFLYIRTRSIVPGLLVHGLYNSALIILNRRTRLDFASFSLGNARHGALLGAVTLCVGASLTWLAVWMLVKSTEKRNTDTHVRSVE